LADHWSAKQVGVVFISRRSTGEMVCLDGYHRTLAARDLGIPLLPAEVYEGLGPDEEAALFVGFNKDRRPLKRSEVFRGQVAAGELEAMDILAIVQSHGLTVGESSHGNVINAAAVLDRIYRSDGGAGLHALPQLRIR